MATAETPNNPALYPLCEGEATEAGRFQAEWMLKHFPERLHELTSPKGVFKGTREEWLEAAAVIMGGWLNFALTQGRYYSLHRGKAELKYISQPLLKHLLKRYGGKPSDYTFNPSKVAYACSLQDGGFTKGRALAHVHYDSATGNGKHEIRMSVELGGRKTKGDSARVADVLLHEMIHTCATRHGHGGAFALIAKNIGLEGRMTATVAGKQLSTRIWDEVVSTLGRYPHAAVELIPRGQRGKGSRLKKCECLQCGFNFRTTGKWILENRRLNATLQGVSIDKIPRPVFYCPTCTTAAPPMVVQGFPLKEEEE
jgi:hypothetical protein